MGMGMFNNGELYIYESSRILKIGVIVFTVGLVLGVFGGIAIGVNL